MNDEDCNEVACGDQAAKRFLLTYFSLVHVFDDVYDKDKEVTDERLVKVMLWWTEELLYNPWVREHSNALWSQIITGWNAWLDANVWAKQPNPKLFASDVIKSNYQEMTFLVAYICGGREHMRAMSTKYREYNFEKGE